MSISQEQLGAACGISFQQVQKYESGANRVSFSRLVQIAGALDCRVSDLTRALDQPQVAPVDLEFMELMTLPGAVELLKRYKRLPTGSRTHLLNLLGGMLPSEAPAPVGVAEET